MANLRITVDGDKMNIGGTLDLWPGWGYFQRREAVKARRMEYPFEVDSSEGPVRGFEGDYLVVDALGIVSVLPGAAFDGQYVLVAAVEPPPDSGEETGVPGASVLEQLEV